MKTSLRNQPTERPQSLSLIGKYFGSMKVFLNEEKSIRYNATNGCRCYSESLLNIFNRSYIVKDNEGYFEV